MNALTHFLKVMCYLDQPETQVTSRESEILQRYASEAQTIVELGCYEGKTTIALAASTTGHVYSVDPFLSGRLGIRYGRIIARTYFRRSGMKNVTFIEDFSFNASYSFHEVVDMVFIDADHSFEASTQDWGDWFPKVRPGGVIAMHDARPAPNSPAGAGSHRFFKEYVSRLTSIELLDGIDSLAVMRKLQHQEPSS